MLTLGMAEAASSYRKEFNTESNPTESGQAPGAENTEKKKTGQAKVCPFKNN
jgi:hypothetical protein